MRRYLRAGFLAGVMVVSLAAGPAWSPDPWLADLKQLRGVIDADYPNLDWLTGQREASLDRWFDRTADALRQSRDDTEARQAMDRLIARFNDGHVVLRWPAPKTARADAGTAKAAAGSPGSIAAFCAARGYDAGQVSAGTAAALPGYRAVNADGPFATGTVNAAGKMVGIVRIGVFQPQGYPALCEQAVATRRIAWEKPCDDACDDRLLTEAYALMTRGLMTAIDRLRATGATVLLVDLTRNGGGSEWAEAAARIIAPVSLRSAPVYVKRGEAWVRRWRDLADRLRREVKAASSADRAALADFARRAESIAVQVTPCSDSSCSRLAQAGFASGLVAEMPAGRLDGRAWAADVFSAAQFPYRDSVWKGPVIVLVDSETWSAAEQFAALLRDNDAAIVMGGRTGGAGCGHLHGTVPITLFNSGGILELPNCARRRKDGSNEVNGIVPDVLTGARWNDGAAYAGRLTAARLAEAIAQAELLRHQRLDRP